jgi:hypothetical protein
MTFLVIGAYALIGLVDVPTIIRFKQWRVLALYVVIFSAGLVISILLVRGVEVPSLLEALEDLFESVFGKIYP